MFQASPHQRDMSNYPEGEIMDIRLATPKDAEIISELNKEAQQLHAEAFPNHFKSPSQETFPASFISQLLADPDKYIFIAFSKGSPVGYIYTQIIRRAETSLRKAWDRLYIHQMSVNQAFQRRGLGRALLQTAMNLAKERGISTISLDVWSFNTRAKDFYISQGFEVFNESMWLHLGEE